MIAVKLSFHEIEQAAGVGLKRRIASWDRPNRVDEAQNNWESEIQACIAELAVAKATNQYWGGSVNTFKGPDVGDGKVQVRSTPYREGHLILRPKSEKFEADDPQADYYLVVTHRMQQRKFFIFGPVRGEDVMSQEFYRTNSPPPAWWVPQDVLEGKT